MNFLSFLSLKAFLFDVVRRKVRESHVILRVSKKVKKIFTINEFLLEKYLKKINNYFFLFVRAMKKICTEILMINFFSRSLIFFVGLYFSFR